MKKSNLLLIAVMAVVIAFSYVGYTNFNETESVDSGVTQIDSLSGENLDLLKQDVGADSFNADDYKFFSYVGVHSNIFEENKDMKSTVIKVDFEYAMKGEEVIMVFQPEMDIASTLNGTVEVLMEPEFAWEDNRLMVTSRIRHEVPSDGELYRKIDNIAVLVEL